MPPKTNNKAQMQTSPDRPMKGQYTPDPTHEDPTSGSKTFYQPGSGNLLPIDVAGQQNATYFSKMYPIMTGGNANGPTIFKYSAYQIAIKSFIGRYI